MKKIYKNFTLIETILAIAILALGLVASMSMSSSSKVRIDKAYKHWKAQNMLSQAAEYYLLSGTDNVIPNSIFPFDNVQASCTISECEALPKNIDTYSDQWFLATYHIEISSNGKILKDIKIDKIDKKE